MSQQLQTTNKNQQPAVMDIRKYIQSDVVKKQIAMVLPKHLTADVMARVVCTAILKQPLLAECRIESLLQSVMLLSQFGLLPDGRNAHLIPYWNTKANCRDCQAIIDWKGKVARASENGVENITTDIVCMNDNFTWSNTSDGFKFEHEVDWHSTDRGAMFAAYCVWKLGGKFSGVIMPKAEIDDIRRRSKSADKGPWVTDYNEMAKKTVVHRASKLWPLDAKFREAIEVQEVTSPAIDLPALPVIEESELAKQIEQPTATAPTAAAPKISEGDAARTTILEAEVPLEMLVAEVTARNIALGADQWKSYDDVPAGVFESLAASPKALGTFVKKFGKKS